MVLGGFLRPLPTAVFLGDRGSSTVWLDGHAVPRQPVLSVHPKTVRYSSACTEERILSAVMSNKLALVKAFGKAAATVPS